MFIRSNFRNYLNQVLVPTNQPSESGDSQEVQNHPVVDDGAISSSSASQVFSEGARNNQYTLPPRADEEADFPGFTYLRDRIILAALETIRNVAGVPDNIRDIAASDSFLLDAISDMVLDYFVDDEEDQHRDFNYRGVPLIVDITTNVDDIFTRVEIDREDPNFPDYYYGYGDPVSDNEYDGSEAAPSGDDLGPPPGTINAAKRPHSPSFDDNYYGGSSKKS